WMRGALNEDIVDVFTWAETDGKGSAAAKLNRLKWPATPVFGTSRLKPDTQDCERLMELFKAHDIHHVFLNGGNDTQEKAIILSEFAKKQSFELHVIGIPKTVDNDLLVTHRCPGYASFAKQVALVTAPSRKAPPRIAPGGMPNTSRSASRRARSAGEPCGKG